MTETDAALSHLAESLASAVQSGAPSRLRDYLSGRKLPAVGGDLDRADILLRAIPLVQEPTDFPRRLALALGPLILEEAAELRATGDRLPPKRRALLLTALYLAAELPPEESLFAALKKLLECLQKASELRLPLWRALVYQQTDASLEQQWLAILQSAGTESLTPTHQTLLLTAWRGLLWIPPEQAGRIVDFDRISRGLVALYGGLSIHYGPDLEGPEARLFLNTCLDIMGETYPRSGEFWVEHFLHYTTHWPRELAILVLLKWSSLTPEAIQEAREQTARILEQTIVDLASVEEQMQRQAQDLIRALNDAVDQHRVAFLTLDMYSIARQMADYDRVIRFWEDVERQSRDLGFSDPRSRMEEVEAFRARQSEIESLLRAVRKAG